MGCSPRGFLAWLPPPVAPVAPQFLVQQKLMDYSLLLGIHEVERGEQEEEEELEEEELGGGDEGGLGGPYSTSPEGLGGLLNSYRPLGPGEFDPCVDVYALRGAEGEPGGGFWGAGGGVGGSGALSPPGCAPPGAPRREVYFMGLIDVLTQYDARKKAAHAAKTVKHGVRGGPQTAGEPPCIWGGAGQGSPFGFLGSGVIGVLDGGRERG